MNWQRSINFRHIALAARAQAPEIVARWLPNGRREGREWAALNPKRPDHHNGSFKVNLQTGRWADFASGDKGGDLVSLAAFLFDLKQDEAALRVAQMLGINPYVR